MPNRNSGQGKEPSKTPGKQPEKTPEKKPGSPSVPEKGNDEFGGNHKHPGHDQRINNKRGGNSAANDNSISELQ